MQFLTSLVLFRTRHWVALYFTAALLGALIGFFFLYPINEFVYYFEHERYRYDAENVIRFVTGELMNSLRGKTPMKTTFYAFVGAFLGCITALLYTVMHRRWLQIQQLIHELDKDLEALIKQGENPHLEFKSSLRWDIVENRVNRALEGVVIKTLAGFMNGQGGTLLIGVDDDGEILGLEKDYQTLKKPGQDGYEQLIMTMIASNMGADMCQFVRVVFHDLDGLDICRLMVLPSTRPVFIQQGNNPKLYLRTGGGTRELNVQEAMDYMKARWHK